MIAFLLLAAAAASSSPIHAYRDWSVGCDNGGVCEAVSLAPERDDSDDWWSLHVSRGPGAADAPQFSLELGEDETAPASLSADGRKVAAHLVRQGDRVRVDAADGPALLAALRSAQRLDVADARGGSLGFVSLAGASAALLYMDDRQQRVGTVSALARPGPKPASGAAPAWPAVALAPASSLAPRTLPAAELRRWQSALCGDEPAASPPTVDIGRLDAGHSLALVSASCLSGAYNAATLPLVAGASGTWAVPGFDDGVITKGEDVEDQILFGAAWRDGRLTTIMYGRGLGDCGGRATYGWDGTRFRRVGQWQMDSCRGAHDWIRIWHAEAR